MTMTGISGMAAVRAADAMLRTLGGAEVVLLFAAAGLPADRAAELGLVDPGVEQVAIAPVIVRELTTENNGPRRRIELVAGRSAMAEQVSQRNVASAEVLFETALGVVYGGDVFHIEGFVVERFAGVSYLYRVVAVA
jgi:hypothetical protein